MLELYVLATLGAVGYIANLSNKKTNHLENNKKYVVSRKERPSMKNAHHSDYFAESSSITDQKTHKMYQKSLDPINKKVINKNFAMEKDEIMDKKVRSLTGELLDNTKFTHNNMTPYFGGRIRQNMDDKSNKHLLDTFTGSQDWVQKKEVESMYDRSRDVGCVNGMTNNDSFYQDRMVKPVNRNNETPFEQVYVGPGVGQGYNAKPSGGFHQYEAQDFVREQTRSVDDLRVLTNPKETYTGRIIDGQKSGLRGDIGVVEKRRPNTFYETTPEHWFHTTGANLKPSEIPDFLVKPTNRLDTTTEYMGTAVKADAKSRANDPTVQATLRQQFGEYGLHNPSLAREGKGDSYDYGRSDILVYTNERDITSTKVYQGNLTSLIKAIVAPIEDMIKTTRKDETVDNPRHFGNMSIQMPEKSIAYDPNDVARTTIKETLIHDSTTGVMTGPKQLYVYDPDEVAKTTTRQTLDDVDYVINMARTAKKSKVYDPDDVARTTTKETTEDTRYTGGINAVERQGDYDTTDFTPKNVQKQFLSDYEHFGHAKHDQGQGYETNEYDAKNTQKQFLSDHEHFGHADSIDKKPMSYDDMFNAFIRSRQEEILENREPTLSGTKTYIAGDDINMKARKQQCDFYQERAVPNKDRIDGVVPTLEDITLTRTVKDYDPTNRLDPAILDAYLENPYTKPLNSVA